MILLRKSNTGRLIADNLTREQVAHICNSNLVNKHELLELHSIYGFDKSVADLFAGGIIEIEGTTDSPYDPKLDGTWYCLRLHQQSRIAMPLLHVQISEFKFKELFRVPS